MTQQDNGFTLIELMIVVAIVGILATIALRAYLTYTARAQASEAIVLLEGIRLNVDDFALQAGDFPGSTAQLLALGSRVQGRYVSIINAQQLSEVEGLLIATFKDHGTATPISGTSVAFRRVHDGSWRCSSRPETTTPAQYLPSTCR